MSFFQILTSLVLLAQAGGLIYWAISLWDDPMDTAGIVLYNILLGACALVDIILLVQIVRV